MKRWVVPGISGAGAAAAVAVACFLMLPIHLRLDVSNRSPGASKIDVVLFVEEPEKSGFESRSLSPDTARMGGTLLIGDSGEGVRNIGPRCGDGCGE